MFIATYLSFENVLSLKVVKDDADANAFFQKCINKTEDKNYVLTDREDAEEDYAIAMDIWREGSDGELINERG